MGASAGVMNALESTSPQHLKMIEESVKKGSALFLKDEEARELFIEYLKQDDWKDELGNTAIYDRILSDTLNIAGGISSDIYADVIFSEKPSELAKKVSKTDKIEIEKFHSAAFEETRKTIKNLLLAAVFPRFLKSSQYAAFLEMKSYDSDVVVDLPPDRSNDGTSREERLDEMFAKAPASNTKDVIARAVATVDTTELNTLLSSGQWVKNIFAAVEDLRLCVSIATARSDRYGFPLIYVNKAFEQTTGYLRSDIVGQNCKFLQCEKTEADQIQQLVNALSKAQPVKVVITNRRKNGTGITK